MNKLQRALFALLLAPVSALLAQVNVLPSGTMLEIRLEQGIYSYSTKAGAEVRAVLIAPVRIGSKVVLPAGLSIFGSVRKVNRIGLGVVHESSLLDIDWKWIDTVARSTALHAVTVKIDNARETVDTKGRIHGVRQSGTLMKQSASWISSAMIVNPILFAFTTAASSSLMGMGEPEISFPAGAEMFIQLKTPLPVESLEQDLLPPVTSDPAEMTSLLQIIRSLPHTTTTEQPVRQSDLTNVIVIAEKESLGRAFQAAGWIGVDGLNSQTRYQVFKSTVTNEAYQDGPMSKLFLDGAPPEFSFAKALNTFAKRHHIRMWPSPWNWNGNSVWTGASTEDVGYGLAKSRRKMIHMINPQIDDERAKVVNDLSFTGCVEALSLVPRDWVPSRASNGTGQTFVTDRSIAVIKLNDCESPRVAGAPLLASEGLEHGGRMQRAGRHALLTLRNDVFHGNIGWLGYQGIHSLLKRDRAPQPIPMRQMEQSSAAQAPALLASDFQPMLRTRMVRPNTAERPDPWAVSRIEFGMDLGGLPGFTGSSESLSVRTVPIDPGGTSKAYFLNGSKREQLSFGSTVTFNTARYFSQELAFFFQKSSIQYQTNSPDSAEFSQYDGKIAVQTRQVGYSAVWHFKSRESRIRPFVAGGPAMRMVNLTEGIKTGTGGAFRFGLPSVGFVTSAYGAGARNLMEGGAAYQPAISFGGGVKIRMTPHMVLKFDLRQTISRQPDYLAGYISSLRPEGAQDRFQIIERTRDMKFMPRLSLGFAYSF